MTLEKFKNILNLQVEHYKKEQKLYELGLVLCDINDSIQSVVAGLWEEVLTHEGDSWVSWFLYEKDYISGNLREDMKAWDENGNEIIKNVDELHEYLTINSYFRAKNKITKEIKNTCYCSRAEIENGEHYCKNCLNENPLLCN